MPGLLHVEPNAAERYSGAQTFHKVVGGTIDAVCLDMRYTTLVCEQEATIGTPALVHLVVVPHQMHSGSLGRYTLQGRAIFKTKLD